MKIMVEKINNYWFPSGHFNEDQRDYFIKVLTKLKPKTILEIGWASGRSCITSLIAGNPTKMISVDLNLDYITNARSHSETFKKDFKNWSVIEGDSNKILTHNFLNNEFPNGIDFIFVDGCHDYRCAKLDCENSYRHLNNGGIMIVDDFMSGPPNGWKVLDVENAVNDFAMENNLTYETWYEEGKGFAIFKK